ncbi:uncharacterized mitochondrial protein-like protein [Tanacetum coccineum]
MTDTQTSSFKSPLKVDKDWKEKFFYPANHVSEVEPKKVRKNNDAPIIKDWVLDDEDEDESPDVWPFRSTVNTVRARRFNDVNPQHVGFGDQSNPMVHHWFSTNIITLMHKADPNFKDFDEGYVTFGGGAYGGKITGKGIQRVSESSTSSQQDQDNQDCIVMPIWKDASYFGDAAPRSVVDAQIQDKDGLHNENDATEKSHDDSSLKDNGTAINTARPEINTGSREVSTASYFYVSLLILIEAIKIFLAYASYMGFMVYQMDVESAFLYGQIEEDVYVCQPPGFEDPNHHDKYNYTNVKSASTPTDLEKPLVQDGDVADVDEHLYRSMIGSLMYLTASRSDIMFAACTCARFQVSPKTSHLLAIKRIFRYLKGKPSLRLWYLKDSPLELVAYTDSDYAGATQDRKSTIRICQFLGNKLISWQCKRQTIVATSTTEVEYVAVASCCGQHNMAAFLEKSTGSEGFHQVIDFLSQSHISYALTKKPEIYISFIKQFWRIVKASTNTNGEVTITAIIDGQSKTITEAFLRRHLKLEDHDGITSIPNSEIFKQLALMGYQTDSDKLTFQKGVFSPQWRFLIHTLLHCLSPKKTDWEQFSRVEIGLFPTMLTSSTHSSSPTPSSSPSRITSSPSLSSEPSTKPTFEPQPLPDAEYHVPTPNESPLHVVHSHGSDEGSLKLIELMNLVTKLSERIRVLEDDLKRTKQTYSVAFTKLILRIKKFESKVKTGKARKRASVVLSEDEEDDYSKQGRIDEDLNTYFAQDDEVVHDQDTAKEGQLEDSTAGITVSTAPINISTARESHSTARRVVYGRRSKEARKDKGKEIMTEPEPEKKSKKLLELERLGLEEAIRLQEQVDEEERAQVARDVEERW